jgi:hypothetical protein
LLWRIPEKRALSGVVEGLDLDEVADLDDVDASS